MLLHWILNFSVLWKVRWDSSPTGFFSVRTTPTLPAGVTTASARATLEVDMHLRAGASTVGVGLRRLKVRKVELILVWPYQGALLELKPAAQKVTSGCEFVQTATPDDRLCQLFSHQARRASLSTSLLS
jgi:hypothetical protein